jgi:hypothetical protein
MKKIMIATALLFGSLTQAQAAVTCSGVISEVNNYNNSEILYILLNTTNRYVYLQTKTAEAMALAALDSGKTVTFHMAESGYTTCSGGSAYGSWENGALVSGWFHVNK